MDPSLLTGSRPIRAITARHWLSPSSFTPSCTGVPCGRAFPGLPVRGTVGLTTFRLRNMRATRDLAVRRCGVAVSVDPRSRESTIRGPQLRASSLKLQLWLVYVYDACASSLVLSLFCSNPCPSVSVAGRLQPPLAVWPTVAGGYVSRELHTRRLLPLHVPVGSAG